jgi:multiple sugar transport system substrate-binding protein
MGYFSRMTSGIAGVILAAGMAASPAVAQKVALDVFYSQPSFAKYHEPIAEAFMKAPRTRGQL